MSTPFPDGWALAPAAPPHRVGARRLVDRCGRRTGSLVRNSPCCKSRCPWCTWHSTGIRARPGSCSCPWLSCCSPPFPDTQKPSKAAGPRRRARNPAKGRCRWSCTGTERPQKAVPRAPGERRPALGRWTPRRSSRGASSPPSPEPLSSSSRPFGAFSVKAMPCRSNRKSLQTA